MTASRKNTARSSRAKRKTPAAPLSDMARVEAHAIAPHEYDEAPDMADFDLAKGTIEVAGKPMRGRPALGDKAKRLVTLRLDPAVIDHFKAQGRGWQARVNDALMKAAGLKAPRGGTL